MAENMTDKKPSRAKSIMHKRVSELTSDELEKRRAYYREYYSNHKEKFIYKPSDPEKMKKYMEEHNERSKRYYYKKRENGGFSEEQKKKRSENVMKCIKKALEDPSRSFHCEACNKSYLLRNKEKHLSSLKHIKNTRANEPSSSESDEEEPVICTSPVTNSDSESSDDDHCYGYSREYGDSLDLDNIDYLNGVGFRD